jgi:hypothetical protein
VIFLEYPDNRHYEAYFFCHLVSPLSLMMRLLFEETL